MNITIKRHEYDNSILEIWTVDCSGKPILAGTCHEDCFLADDAIWNQLIDTGVAVLSADLINGEKT